MIVATLYGFIDLSKFLSENFPEVSNISVFELTANKKVLQDIRPFNDDALKQDISIIYTDESIQYNIQQDIFIVKHQDTFMKDIINSSVLLAICVSQYIKFADIKQLAVYLNLDSNLLSTKEEFIHGYSQHIPWVNPNPILH